MRARPTEPVCCNTDVGVMKIPEPVKDTYTQVHVRWLAFTSSNDVNTGFQQTILGPGLRYFGRNF